jgi:hypothetical protein
VPSGTVPLLHLFQAFHARLPSQCPFGTVNLTILQQIDCGSCFLFLSIRGFDHPFCGYSSRAFPLAELVYQHGRNDEHPDCDLEDKRIYPQEISPIP